MAKKATKKPAVKRSPVVEFATEDVHQTVWTFNLSGVTVIGKHDDDEDLASIRNQFYLQVNVNGSQMYATYRQREKRDAAYDNLQKLLGLRRVQ